MPLNNPIRDLREGKNLSQDAVAEAAGLTYSVFYRIESGTGKTTQDEIDKVVKVLNKMKPGTRKLAGRPFGDPKVQAAVKKARESGGSVAAVLAKAVPAQKTASSNGKAPATGKAPAKATKATKATTKKTAPAKKTTTRSRKAAAESLI
jgi:transcriptional regulator with XRE-family HTH domain